MSETAGRTRGRGLEPSTRGVLVLAVVVVLGLVLLAKAAPSSSTSVASPIRSNATAPTSAPRPRVTAPVTTTAVPGVIHPPAQVKVLLMNATNGKVPKAAALNGAKVKAAGFVALAPANANAPRPVTAVYYAPGYQADAVAVAKVLRRPASVAAPLPTPSPAPSVPQANVVVVLGQDTPAA